MTNQAQTITTYTIEVGFDDDPHSNNMHITDARGLIEDDTHTAFEFESLKDASEMYNSINKSHLTSEGFENQVTNSVYLISITRTLDENGDTDDCQVDTLKTKKIDWIG